MGMHFDRVRHNLWLVPLLLTGVHSLTYAQEAAPAPPTPDTYRVRIENVRWGRIEASTDGGEHYRLIGRVMKPATATGDDRAARETGQVLRSSGEGLAFSAGAGKALKLLPRQAGPPKDRRGRSLPVPPLPASAVLTNLEPRQSLFAELLLPPKTPVRLQSPGGDPIPLTAEYAPAEEDVWIFTASLPDSDAAKRALLAKQIEALAEKYQAGAQERAKTNGTQILSGTLTLRAKLPEKEPDPITFVTYSVDGDIVSTQSTAPFVYDWDTGQVANGEHVVEIRGLNKQGNLLTRARALIVVQNAAAPPPK